MTRIEFMKEIFSSPPKAKYSYFIKNYEGKSVLVIFDEGGPETCSVTNDMENVLNAIAKIEGSQIFENPIVYKDSEGMYDGVKMKSSSSTAHFIIIGSSDMDTAIKEIFSK